jgi:hypothetical protein
MTATLPPPTEPSRMPVYFIAAFCCLLAILYGFAGITPGPGVEFGLRFLPLFAVAHWLVRDGRARRNRSLEAWGLLFYGFWPLLLPAYALRTRGRSGWMLILELYALILVANLGTVEGQMLHLLVAR